MSFVHLHCHSDHSLRDGFQSVEQILSYTSALGQSAVALTDHGTMSGCGEGFRYADKYGIKFIVGCEHYLVPDVTIKDKFSQHIILLAMNKEGYRNLNIITTLAHSPENFYFKPRIDLEMLRKYNEGLICTTACIAGCQSKIMDLLPIFKDRLYIEIHTNQMEKQKKANIEWLKLAETYDIPYYVAVDAHYTTKEQAAYQRKWTGYLYEDDPNIVFDNGVWYDNTGKEVHPYEVQDDYYLHSEEEVREALSYLPKEVVDIAIATTQEVADRCTFKMEMGNNHYPKSPYSSPKDEVRMRVWEGMKNRGLQKNTQHINQVRHELDILGKVGYFDYFLIVSDMLRHCERNNIRTGVGRGSVVGCDVAYLMGITKIDPIKNGLIFERFAHTERVTPPDIDTDVPRSKRQDVIQYLKDTYGNVYQVVTFGKMGDKAAIRRTCDAFGLTASEKEEISANPKLKENDESFMKTVEEFNGKIQNFGTHASAVVVMTTDPYDFCAVERFSGTKGAQYNLNYDFHDLESMGLLKLDILGLETLDTIENTLAQIPEEERPDMDNLIEDKKTYELLNSGLNCGLFQLEGNAVGQMMKGVRPKCLADLTAIVALGRPGPMTSGMSEKFLDIETPIVSWQKDFTEDTRGCIIYQEQVMALCQKVWGMTLGEADMIRRAMGRKDKALMEKLVHDLQSRKNYVGLNAHQIELVLEDLDKQASYLFNKSHAAAYAYTAYQTAYLKAHFPLQFYCALLNSNIDQSKGLEYLAEIRKNYEIEMPDIVRSDKEWKVDNGKLLAGFSFIRGVGGVQFEKPENDGEYGLVEFLELNPKINIGVASNLIKSGCFCVDPLWGIAYAEWFKMSKARTAECRGRIIAFRNKGDYKKVAEWTKKINEIPNAPISEDYDTPIDVIGEMQKEVLGFTDIDLFASYDKSLVRGNNKLFFVDSISRFNDRKGNPMFKFEGQGQNNRMTCIFWNPKTELLNRLNEIQEGKVYIIRVGQPKENNTYFCYDFIEAKRVA